MKVLIVSDTHGRDKYLFQVLQKVSPIDLMIHLGDYGGTEEYINSIANCPVEMISGNNDFFKGYPKEKVIKMFGHTHVPMIDLKDVIWAINPGSIALPRQRNRLPSFIIMDIDRDGKAHFTLNYCDE